MPYATVTSEGGLLPTEILDAATAGDLFGQRPEDFGFSSATALAALDAHSHTLGGPQPKTLMPDRSSIKESLVYVRSLV